MAFWVRGMFWVYTSRDIVSASRKGRIFRNKIAALNIDIIWSFFAEAIFGGRPFPIFKPELSKLAVREREGSLQRSQAVTL